MTLLLSVTNCNGISMAADSMVTSTNPSTSEVQTTPNAAKKLRAVPQLGCGVGMWGKGQINGQDTDEWLEAFLDEADNMRSITILAHRLAARLETAIPTPRSGQSTIGFLICGMDQDFRDLNGIPSPVCWHVHDGPSTTLKTQFNVEVDPTRINPNNDVPEGILCRNGHGRYETCNGDFQPYALANRALNSSLEMWQEFFGRQVPRSAMPSDEANFLVFKIRMISDLYQLSQGHQVIGGRIDWLTVDTQGHLESGSLA
jgi:hypothetical protein